MPSERPGHQGHEWHDHVQRCRDEEREAWRALQAISEQLAERAGHPDAREGLRADYERAYRTWHQARYALDLVLVPLPRSSLAPEPCSPLRDQPREID